MNHLRFQISQLPEKKILLFKIPLFVFFLFSFSYSIAQTGILWKCGSDIMRQENFNEHPQTKLKNDSIENALYLIIQQQFQQKQLGGGGTLPTPMQLFTIPVVAHIIHNNGPENIPDAQVIAGIQHLNDAFRNVGVFDPITGVDVEIEFCLAKQDENGNYTTGINRVVSSLTNVTMETDDILLKNLIRWDPTKYFNFWIVKEITSQTMGSGVAGYAYFPSSHGNPEDGLVIEAQYFGFSPNNSKVAVHEVGHYLGLYHTFESGCNNNNCLIDGDKVCDTPPDVSTSPVSCGATINTCDTDDDDLSVNNPFRPIGNGGLGDQDDMYINYMDYGYQTCQSAFTLGQKNRVIPSLTGIRSSLLQSIGCNSVCTNLITVSFNASAANVTAGTSVSFTNTSSGATAYTWQVNGTSFSTSANASYTFNTQGSYIVKLIAVNSDPACTKEYTITIIVTCPVTASFTLGSSGISPGDNVIFTNTSIGATNYQWYLDGIAQGSLTNYNNTFSTAGGFIVSLVASNGTCSDTLLQYVSVGMCKSKEADFWYFGYNAGLDFSSPNPVTVSNSAMQTVEGCATISDKNTGQLLFYTNGVSVWDNTHITMPNGAGLWGHFSTSQSATIVPMPGSSTIYYIFTIDAEVGSLSGGYGGVSYSIVDITLNGGKGDVTAKNQPLLTPTPERLAATRHCNGVDVWVITHQWNSNAFYAYLLTASGISAPIISNIGVIHQDLFNTNNLFRAIGILKVSPNGKKIASTSRLDNNELEIFDFDNSTGIISNLVTIPSSIPDSRTYGLSFSPDNSKLYVSNNGDGTPGNLPKIVQYDLNANNIAASQTIINSSNLNGQLQIANNGKVYCSQYGSSYLDVINNPNALGVACNFVPDAVSLANGLAKLGLPNFIDSYLYEPSIIGQDTVCPDTENVIYLINGCVSNVLWSVYGKAEIVSSIANAVTLNFNGIGIDTLIAEITRNCGTTTDTAFITVLQSATLELGADTVICQGSTITLNAGAGYTSYLWQDATTNPTLTVNSPGLYKVTVTNSSGCSATDSILVSLAAPISSLNLGSDINSCNGGIVVLDAGSGFSTYEWPDGSTNQIYTVYLPGKYWVTVSYCGLVISDTITVSWQSSILVSIAQEGELCAGQSITLNADPTNLASYIWDDGTFSYTRDVLTPGTYWLIVTDANGCYEQDSIEVSVSDCDCVLAVPTAFSPNNDGHNDLFILHGFENCVTTFSFIIFDRWGEKVFETENPAASWDGTFQGKPLNSAVFVYYINAALNSGEKIDKKGNISLIR